MPAYSPHRRIGGRSGRRLLVGMLAAAILVGAAGCQAPHVRMSDENPLPRDGNAALMTYIADQPFVSAEAGYRAVYVLATGEAFAGDFGALRSELIHRDIVAPRWKHDATTALDRAAVGFMLCRAARIRSGVNWVLTGLGRYAWRELHYKGIANPVSEHGYVSGGEFLGLLARTDSYMEKAGRDPLAEPRSYE